MIYIPFVYFTILLIVMMIRQKAFNVGSCVVSIYILSSFFSIVCDKLNLYNNNGINPRVDIELSSIIIYCFMLTITILPFYYFRSDKIRKTICLKPKLFNGLCYFLFFIFILSLVDSISNIRDIILSSNLKDVRGDYYSKMLDKRESLSVLGYITYLFSSYAPLSLLLYFYSIIYLNKSKWFNISLFISSLTLVLTSVLQAGRFAVIYWLMIYFILFILFWPQMSKKNIKNATKPFIVFGGIILFYMVSVTIARFGDSGGKSSDTYNSLFSYMGQPFLNFVHVFQNYHVDNFTIGRILPFTNVYILQDKFEMWKYVFEQSAKSGIQLNVFYTFIGEVFVDTGIIGMIIFVFVFYLLCSMILKRKRSDVINLGQLIILLALIRIPYQGLFSLVYPYVVNTYYLWGTLLLYILFRYRFKTE